MENQIWLICSQGYEETIIHGYTTDEDEAMRRCAIHNAKDDLSGLKYWSCLPVARMNEEIDREVEVLYVYGIFYGYDCEQKSFTANIDSGFDPVLDRNTVYTFDRLMHGEAYEKFTCRNYSEVVAHANKSCDRINEIVVECKNPEIAIMLFSSEQNNKED